MIARRAAETEHVAAARRGGRALAAAAIAAVIFAAGTPWVLRPWFLAHDAFPRSERPLAPMFDADLQLNVWILAWTAHAMLSEPARLFDGNIYYPAPNTIAGSENMLAHLPVTVPALAATANALVVLKAMALESFVLAGLGMFALVLHHTANPAAALVAGAAFTFAPWRPGAMPQPQYLATAYLPLALLAVDCWLERRRARALVGLATAMALQGLACVYLGYFAFITVPAYAAARLVLDVRADRLRALAGLIAGFIGGALAVVPAALPYLHDRALSIIPVQDMGILPVFSWQPATFLRPATFGEMIGMIPVALVVLDLVDRVARRTPSATRTSPRAPVGATWVLAGTALLFAAGPYLQLPGDASLPLPYVVLYRVVPGFSSIRAPARFSIIVAAALCALAGYACARLTAPMRRRVRFGLAGAVAVACVVLAAPRPAATMPAHLGVHAPEAYRWLARQPRGGALLELPGRQIAGDVGGAGREAAAMVGSTIHWQPLLGGYTAYPPPSAAFFVALAARMPDADALGILVDSVDVRWILVHAAALPPPVRRQWDAFKGDGVVLAARFDRDYIYEVKRTPRRPWRGEILRRARTPAADTLEGAPTTPLSAACRAASIVEVAAPESMLPAPSPVPVRVRLENRSPCTWPALGVRPEGLVGLTYRWTSPSGRLISEDTFSRLLHDVSPGAIVEAPVLVFPGAEFGTWQLEVLLVQYGQEEPLASRTASVRLERWKIP